jgi:hypothetical protein
MSDSCLCDYTPDGVLCAPCCDALGMDFEVPDLDEEWGEW